ncbi:hypothetical protein MTR_6g079360 [Medicago truncatula]|uniref:Uncharacterized protein n=1 Tax=Medicago truncatula TaxID=3880 RepID=A0A072UBF4_MEDTR|nr:hypothetical protein MTR_6g079360 [Medicago truncatula]
MTTNMTNITIFKSSEYSCLQICNVDDDKVIVIDRINTYSKLIFQPKSNKHRVTPRYPKGAVCVSPPNNISSRLSHNISDMVLDFEKKLTEYDVTKGCMLTFATIPYEHFKRGRRWNRFVEARRLCEGVKIRGGAPMVGSHDTIYLDVIYN